MAEFEHRVQCNDSHVLLTLAGQLSIEALPDLDSVLAETPTSKPWVIVDLAGVESLGSPAIAALILLQRRTAATGGRVALVGARPQIARVLDLSGVQVVMTIAPTAAAVLTGPTQ